MKIEDIKVEDLIAFREEAEITYCSQCGTVNKKLTCTASGAYRVYHNGKIVGQGISSEIAVGCYNSITK